MFRDKDTNVDLELHVFVNLSCTIHWNNCCIYETSHYLRPRLSVLNARLTRLHCSCSGGFLAHPFIEKMRTGEV